MEGEENVTKPRLCSMCKRPVKGHLGPYGSQCQNLPTPLADDFSRADRPDPHASSSRKERMDSHKAESPSNDEFNDLLLKINELLQNKRRTPMDNFAQNQASLPYFAEHIPISDDLHKAALEGSYIDLTKLALSTEEGESAIASQPPDTQAKKKRTISSFQAWLGAWNVYEAILIRANPGLYKSCAEYRNFILDCSNKYQWIAVYQFDMKHRIKLSSRRSFDFGSIDHTLFIITFDSSTIKKRGTCFRCKSTDHFVGNCPFLEEKDKMPKTNWSNQPTAHHQGKEICNKFQAAQCVYPQCKRAHVCRICRGPMPYSRCNVCQSQPFA